MELTVDGGTIALHGSFDVRSTGLVREALHSLMGCTSGDVVLDLSGVEARSVPGIRAHVQTGSATNDPNGP